ncbi:uncharacterized protein FRV6_08066 [Fusarium oxysporum]|uniref:Uncharacterized protein n=1 Tax=Fusarium oxysporum TaxID=5507 RepID=A0A2H3TQ19_FUSOX|nr:uncharacterized protein FRV6_08066 [Fusarium oxysporum]
MGHVMKPSKLKDHWENHVRLEHVPANSEPSYERGEPRPFKSSPLYESIYEVSSLASFESFNRGKDNGVHHTMTTDPDVGNTEGDGLDLMEEDNELDLMEESSTSFEQDYNLGLLQENSSEYFSQKQRGEMLAQNTQFWENHKHQKVYLHARGYTCLGPGINTQYNVTKPCPFGATIDFDTARLRQTRRENGPKDIVLDTTCASSSKRNVDMDLLREIFGRTLHKRWSAQPSYERVKQRLEEIRKGNQPDIKPLILDTEYTIAGQQLMEFSFIDLDSGDVLINTLVEHSQGIRHIAFSRDPSTRKRLLKTSEGHEAKVYSAKRKLSRLGVHEIAEKIQKSGITSDSLILVWAFNCKDLQLVRGFLEKGGYKNLLPSDDNCIPLVQLFRPHFPKLEPRKQFPLKLGILFPMMFPGSKLVGRNHEALFDCLQTRLLFKALCWLCKPVKKRGKTWRPETIDGDDYRVSQDFLPDGNVKKRRSSRLQALEANKTESKRLKLCGKHQKD